MKITNKNWKKVRLGDHSVLEIIDGDRGKNYPKNNEMHGSGFCLFLNAGNVRNGVFDFSQCIFISKEKDGLLRKGKLNRNDIVLTTRGTIGNNAYYSENIQFDDVRINSGMVILRCNQEVILPQFLSFYLRSDDFQYQLQGISSGSAQPQSPIKDLVRISFYLPSLDEQKAIAEVLGSLDDKIDLLRRQNKTLEEMARIVFREMFIEGSERERIRLHDVFSFEKGTEPGSKQYKNVKFNNSIRFIRVRDMMDANTSVFVDRGLDLRFCKEDDVIVSFDGTVGKVNFGVSGAYSSGIKKIVAKNTVYDSVGLKYILFKSEEVQDILRQHASGTVIMHASSSIPYLTLRLPAERAIRQFTENIKPLFSKILANQKQIQTLEKTRDILLPKLMSGEVRIED